MQSAANFFAIGDIHGCAEELKTLLHKLDLGPNSTILFLGDYVDRGPDSKGVIETILDLSQIYKVITLKGNHEWLFSQYLANPDDPLASSNFILNGGSNTLASYSEDGLGYQIPYSHRAFLAGLQVCHSTESHFYVHAGVPPGFEFSGEIDAKTAHQFLWIRSAFLDSTVQWPKIVVHGHTPVSNPEILPNRINLDTGCVFGRRLTAMNMVTGELFSVERDVNASAKFLISTMVNGVRRPLRYSGEVSVEIRLGEENFRFRTANFNEFGLLIFPTPGSEHLQFALGQNVAGLINPGGEIEFDFAGSVVRTTMVSGVMGFGIKFDALRNLRDFELD